jgi:hypothetical protein
MKIVLVLSLLFLATGRTAPAQSPGTFTPTGSMITPRFFHTATLLADGRVLIAGGGSRDARTGAFITESSAEVYDPRAGAFTATGKMTTPRSRHTATLLPDGRVLIAGGVINENSAGGIGLASAELYDPRTGTFTSTGEMATARDNPAATLLNDGKVLIVSWCYTDTGHGCFPVSAELYDPDTGAFAATGNRDFEGVDTATLLPNGKVLITSGNPPAEPYRSWAELYDPSTGTFTATGYAVGNHTAPTATLMTNGKVLIAGGDMADGDGGSAGAEIYDPATGVFLTTGYMTVGREQHTATLLPDGTVLLAGGHLTVDLAASAEIYDPSRGAFTRTADMPTAHEVHTATLLGDGTVLIAGGFAPWPALTSNAEIYHPAVLVPSPQLFSVSGDGRGQGAIVYANTPQLASPDNPCAIGEFLEIYLTGLMADGAVPPQVVVGGRMAEVLWFGSAPGYSDLNQVNIRVPGGIAPGPAVPVRLTYLGRPSNAVTIGVAKP